MVGSNTGGQPTVHGFRRDGGVRINMLAAKTVTLRVIFLTVAKATGN